MLGNGAQLTSIQMSHTEELEDVWREPGTNWFLVHMQSPVGNSRG